MLEYYRLAGKALLSQPLVIFALQRLPATDQPLQRYPLIYLTQKLSNVIPFVSVVFGAVFFPLLKKKHLGTNLPQSEYLIKHQPLLSLSADQMLCFLFSSFNSSAKSSIDCCCFN